MGREIRRVPPNWEHPRMSNGQYQPMLDKSYFQALSDWIELDWPYYKDAGEIEAIDGPYTPEYCRPAWTSDEATAYQVYENVTEGTPVSPVFVTKDDMRAWLIVNGTSPAAAENFIAGGWAPSFVVTERFDGTVEIKNGIDAFG